VSVTIPRAEIAEIMGRHDDSWRLHSDPPVKVVRGVAAGLRNGIGRRDRDEAAALDALCDRVENERDDHCVAYSHDPDTGECSCGHSDEQHDRELGQCEAPLSTEAAA
jgi:hypothetical protein